MGDRVVGQGGTCANPGEKEKVRRTGEEGERKERMIAGKLLSVDWPPPALQQGHCSPKPLFVHSQWHLVLLYIAGI